VGIALARLPAQAVNLIIYTGRIAPGDGAKFYGALDPDAPANAPRWLTFIDENADFSDIPLTAYVQTKHVLIPKLKRMSERPGYCSGVVCSTAHCEMVTSFWRHYVERDPDYVSHPVFFTNLKDACDWLKLPDAGCQAIAEAIAAQHIKDPPAPRPGRAGGGHEAAASASNDD